MTAPERIWHHPFTDIVVHDAQPERHWECNEYIRADLVQEIVAEAVKAEREAIQDAVQVMRREAGRKADGVRFQALDDVRAAIRARGEG